MKNKLGLFAGLFAGAVAVYDFMPPHSSIYVAFGVLLSILSLANLILFIRANNYFRRGIR